MRKLLQGNHGVQPVEPSTGEDGGPICRRDKDLSVGIETTIPEQSKEMKLAVVEALRQGIGEHQFGDLKSGDGVAICQTCA